MYLAILTFLIILIINSILSFSLIFIERKEPQTTWAWLLIMIILPGLGFIIYLLLGQNFSRERLFKEKKKIDKRKREEIIKTWENQNNEHGANKFIDLIRMNFNTSGAKYTKDNEVQLFFNGEEKFAQLIEDLNNAKKYIHMEYYILRRDKLGNTILDILKKKAEDGVEVRLLVDSMGSYTLTKRYLRDFINKGGKFEIFFPGILPHINTRINYRNHRKIVVIDGEYGYTGGFNVGDEYIGRDKKVGNWRDTHVRIKGEAVRDLSDRFLLDWCYASGEEIEHLSDYYYKEDNSQGDIGIQILTSGPDHNEEYIKNSYVKMINNAKKTVYLQTPYFVPDLSMQEALRLSALSGVDVRIIIPYKPDHMFMKWAASAYCGELLEAGVKIYRYTNGFIHSKTIVVDGMVSSVGSANFDMRSFCLNFEVNAFIYDDRIAGEMEKQYYKDIEDSKELLLEDYQKRSRRMRIKESLMRLISPIL